jgi:type IX secretion system PorP/SprF family membrane protein
MSMFEDFYAGVSATHLTSPVVKLPVGQYGTDRSYYFMSGAMYNLSPTLGLNPNILLKSDLTKTVADINCMAVWNQNIRGGLTWRPGDAVGILAGYLFPFDLYVGYSYDLTTSKILTYSSGTHEFLVRYCFGFKLKTKEKIFIPRLTPRFL